MALSHHTGRLRKEEVLGKSKGGLSKRGLTINTKIFAIQKQFLRGINFVKITKNIFQSTRLPEECMGVTEKIGGRNEFP